MTPRKVVGLIRALPRGAQVSVSVTLTPSGRGHALRISRAAALRMVRLLYRSGQRVSVDLFCGDILLGV